MQPTLKYLPTTELTLHPSAKLLPRMEETSPQFAALVSLMEVHGIQEPIKVNQFRVVCGVDQWEAAKRLGLAKVLVVEVSANDIIANIAATLVAREHYTKGQIAYLSYPMLEPLAAAARKQMIEALKLGPIARSANGSARSALPLQNVEPLDPIVEKFRAAKTAEDLAAALGISRRLFFMAQTIHREFAAAPRLRDRFEPLILDQGEDGAEMGLGAVIAGIAGAKATQGVTPMVQPELQLWRDRMEKMFDPRRFAAWDKATPETRAAAAQVFIDQLSKTVPPEILEAVDRAAATRLGVPARLTVVARQA